MRVRLTITAKFLAVLAVVGPLIVMVAVGGVTGVRAMKAESDAVFDDNIQVSQVLADLGGDLARAEAIANQVALTPDTAHGRGLDAELDSRVIPRVERGLAELTRLHAHDASAERTPVRDLELGWRRFLALRYDTLLSGETAPLTVASATRELEGTAAVLDPLIASVARLDRVETAHARVADGRADRRYKSSLALILGSAAAALLLGLGSVIALIRNVVPRIREYSAFATRVAAGDLSARLHPHGYDDLAQLGHALENMVERRAAGAAQDERQTEFVESMQLAETEAEAHDLLKRHVERSAPGSSVVVLNRNNSADRLEAKTALPEHSPLLEALTAAKPRSCLAMRSARLHERDPDRSALILCEICGVSPEHAICEPLLVSGEVIGSLLIHHPRPLDADEQRAIKDSVSQSAPVIANLRTIAIAEQRAATDALTGMPNSRAARDTLKRMLAQAARSGHPLAAVLLDLDHFKQINDTYGHGAGDDVLASVGSTLTSSLRESDFAGRYGGEEFLLLLPNTSAEDAAVVAEKIRGLVAQTVVAGVERPITASLGVSGFPQHSMDGDTLMRSADRALYTSKRSGRDRVTVALAIPGETAFVATSAARVSQRS
jgi:diguanylate cyclase (GGDEF)-like protein